MKNNQQLEMGERAYLEIINYQETTWDNLVSRTVQDKNSLKDKAMKALGNIQSEVKKVDIGRENGSLSDGKIQVQYNPNTLSIQGSMDKRTNTAENQNRKITTITFVGIVKLTVELLFHAISEMDTSVMDQMTMLLTLMQKTPLKKVRFSWGNMQVTGRIISFQGSYDMFYPSGLPAAGKITLTIQSESEPKKIEKKIEGMTEERSDKMKRE